MIREVRQYAWLRSSVATIGGVFFLGAILTATRLWPMIHESLWPTKISCGCANMAVQPPWWIVGIGFISFIAVLTFITCFITAFVNHIVTSRRQIQSLRQHGFRVVHHHRIGLTYVLVTKVEPVAVTIGLIRATIYISTGLLHRLTGLEVQAVLAHEQAHQYSKDPLMTAIMDSVATTFQWIPRTKAWMAVAYSLRELAADAHATNEYRATHALSSAFLKLNDAVAYPPGNSFSPNRDRIEKLLDQRWSPQRDSRNWISLGMVTALFVAMLTVGHYAKAMVPKAVPQAAAVACHQTIIMCQAEHPVPSQPQTICETGRCVSVEHPWSPAYVISFTR